MAQKLIDLCDATPLPRKLKVMTKKGPAQFTVDVFPEDETLEALAEAIREVPTVKGRRNGIIGGHLLKNGIPFTVPGASLADAIHCEETLPHNPAPPATEPRKEVKEALANGNGHKFGK